MELFTGIIGSMHKHKASAAINLLVAIYLIPHEQGEQITLFFVFVVFFM